MSTIREVARIAGVSTATVSRALSRPERVSEKTLKKVLNAIEKANYRPNMLARNLRSERSYSILVVVPGITNPFFSSALFGVEQAAKKSGYSVLLGVTHGKPELEREYFRHVETRLSDGIIYFTPDPERKREQQVKQFPVVNACGCEQTPTPLVRIDNAAAAYTVVKGLIDDGHTRIACITGRKGNAHVNSRMKGYRKALKEAGIKASENLIHHGDFSMRSGVEIAPRNCYNRKRNRRLFSP